MAINLINKNQHTTGQNLAYSTLYQLNVNLTVLLY
jgi:hypothetical protein